MKIGDTVEPLERSGIVLHNNGKYNNAVVISLDPLILTSKDSRMKWQMNFKQSDFKVTGEVTDEILTHCMRRIND